jgi:hypothetical protein
MRLLCLELHLVVVRFKWQHALNLEAKEADA